MNLFCMTSQNPISKTGKGFTIFNLKNSCKDFVSSHGSVLTLSSTLVLMFYGRKVP